MWQEIRYALRLLVKTPGFSALTLFVLAAGLGIAVYMFALVRVLAFAELPFPDQERLVYVGQVVDGTEQAGNSLDSFTYARMAAEQQSFEQFVQARKSHVTLSGITMATRIEATYSNHQLFELTAVPALRGRPLQASDSETDTATVAVISYRLWRNAFQSADDIVGRVIRIDDLPVTVVGVMPADYAFPEASDMWLPLPALGSLQPGDAPHTSIIGKLKAGVRIADADAELKALAKQLEQQFPQTNSNESVRVWPFSQHTMTNSMMFIAVMIAAAGFILLLVILNAGNLLLVRAAERQKEVAIRSALGAPRPTLVRQLLWEALLLAAAGGFVGVFFASWGMQWSEAQIAGFNDSLPFWWQFRLDGTSLGFAALLTVVTAVSVGLYPAVRISSGDITRFLRDGTRGAQGLQLTRLTQVLVVTEIALSIALLMVALTLIGSTRNTLNADYGARTDNVLIGELDLYTQAYDQDEATHQRFADRLLADLGRQPGVQQVALACHLPGMYGPIWTYLVEGTEVPDQRYPSATRVLVSDNYFSLFEIPLLHGRRFDSRDTASSERVVIISRDFADRHWPGQSPIGKRIGLDRNHDPDNEKWYTVIGVVGEAMYGQPYVDFASYADMYLSIRQRPEEDLMVAVKTDQEPMALAHPLAMAVANADRDIPIHGVRSLNEQIYRYNAGLIFVSNLFLIIAALGVLLAASGIYGVIARSVVLRTQELGVRRALGASEQRVLAMLMRQGGLRFVIGAALGLALGLLLVDALTSTLYGIETQLPRITAGVLLLVGAIVATATLLPARRAVSLSPASALRYE